MAPKILSAGDEQALSEWSTIRLAREGYEVLTAGESERALALARAEKTDVLLPDIRMAMINGLQVCRALKRDRATQSIKSFPSAPKQGL